MNIRSISIAFMAVFTAGVLGQGVSDTLVAEQIKAMPLANLTQIEKEDIQWMREEEKLARDVYLKLYSQWKQNSFSNIASSEQTHMDLVGLLLERYDIPDPAAQNAAGVFTNPSLQKLYLDLTAKGAVSLTEALKVGALIEELDIVDLQKRHTVKPDIQLIYDRLQAGSNNHLRAFVSSLKRTSGLDYTPVYLSPAAFTAIILR